MRRDKEPAGLESWDQKLYAFLVFCCILVPGFFVCVMVVFSRRSGWRARPVRISLHGDTFFTHVSTTDLYDLALVTFLGRRHKCHIACLEPLECCVPCSLQPGRMTLAITWILKCHGARKILHIFPCISHNYTEKGNINHLLQTLTSRHLVSPSTQLLIDSLPYLYLLLNCLFAFISV